MEFFRLSHEYLDKKDQDLTQKDIDVLAGILEYHSDLYYNKQSPIISDYEYDMLFKKLQFLEEKYHIEDKNTHKVGSDVTQSTFEKVAHSRPMISLDNTYNEEDLRDFDERVKKNIKTPPNLPLLRGGTQMPLLAKEGLGGGSYDISYIAEFKFDGLGVELIYKNGNLTQAITRGNGVEGEDITQNVLTIQNIPKTIPYLEHIEVRGEVVMPISSFEKLNAEAKKTGEKIFSNPRNAASGSLRLKDASVTAKRNLKFFAYDIANFQEYVADLPQSLLSKEGSNIILPLTKGESEGVTYFEVIHSLENLGFEISSFFEKCENIEEVIHKIENFGDVKSRIDFEIDGLVIKVNDISLWQEIGFTAHHPRYAIAYKFPAEILTTKILSVDHQVGRTGTITPVANLEPIYIGGVTVKRATLHNYEEVANLGVKVGDSIFIKRAGEVIPKIIGVAMSGNFEDVENILPPELCPSCQTVVKKDEDKVRFYCPNHFSCPEQVKQKLIHSVGREALDIDGLGREQVDLFLEKGWIADLGDIFTLSEKKDLILGEPGYKEKSVNNLLTAIENAKNQDIVRFLVALNIPGIGTQSAKELAKFLKSNEDILSFSLSLEDLIAMNDIGEGTAKNIYEFFHNQDNKKLLEKILTFMSLKFKEEIVGGVFSGKKMCITGSFENYSREQLVAILEKNGGAFVSSVSAKTDFLLAGEKAGSKLKKATELGVEVLNIEEFFEKIAN